MDAASARLRKLAAAVRDLRGGETQEELAERTGVSTRTIAGIETADRSPRTSTLDTLDRAFGIPLGTLSSLRDGTIADIDDILADRNDSSGSSVVPVEEVYEVRGQAYTKDEIRTLAKALGPKGLYDWATGPATSANASDQATG